VCYSVLFYLSRWTINNFPSTYSKPKWPLTTTTEILSDYYNQTSNQERAHPLKERPWDWEHLLLTASPAKANHPITVKGRLHSRLLIRGRENLKSHIIFTVSLSLIKQVTRTSFTPRQPSFGSDMKPLTEDRWYDHVMVTAVTCLLGPWQISMKQWWNYNYQEKTKELGRKTCFSATSSTTNLTSSRPVLNPGLRGKKSASISLILNCLLMVLMLSHDE
jgi:hypothetical protein